MKYDQLVKAGTFAEACFDSNTIKELEEAQKFQLVDKNDVLAWNLSPSEWREGIKNAFTALIIRFICDSFGGKEERIELFISDFPEMIDINTNCLEDCLASLSDENLQFTYQYAKDFLAGEN